MGSEIAYLSSCLYLNARGEGRGKLFQEAYIQAATHLRVAACSRLFTQNQREINSIVYCGVKEGKPEGGLWSIIEAHCCLTIKISQ